MYIMLHYYLNSAKRIDILDKIKMYIYQSMVIDLSVAYFLTRWMSSSVEKEEDDDVVEEDSKDLQESRNKIDENINELRRLQIEMEIEKKKRAEKILENNAIQESNEEKSSSTKDSPFVEISVPKEEQNESHVEENKPSDKKQNKHKSDSDTNIPIFNNEKE
jgi:hypothetical protein